MKPSSLEPPDSAWLNGKTQRFPTARGSELRSHEGQVRLGITEVAEDYYLVARLNFNARQYKNAHSILNALWILLSSPSFESEPLNMMKINLLLPVIVRFKEDPTGLLLCCLAVLCLPAKIPIPHEQV